MGDTEVYLSGSPKSKSDGVAGHPIDDLTLVSNICPKFTSF